MDGGGTVGLGVMHGDMVVSISVIVELTRSQLSLSDDSEAEVQDIKGLSSQLSAVVKHDAYVLLQDITYIRIRLECGTSLTENRNGWTSGG